MRLSQALSNSGNSPSTRLLPGVCAAVSVLLASCQSSPQTQLGNYQRFTSEQQAAAQIQLPRSTSHRHLASNPLHAQQPQSHSNGVHHNHAVTPSLSDQYISMYGGLYSNPREAGKAMPPYASVYPSGFHQHVVQSGQTFSGILEGIYRVDRRVGWFYNQHLKNPHRLHPGGTLKIPGYQK